MKRSVLVLLSLLIVYGCGCEKPVLGQSETEPMPNDDMAPTVSLELNRMSVLVGEPAIPITVNSTNLATIRLLNQDGELVNVSEAQSALTWDTTTVASGIHSLYLQVVDDAGNTSSTDPIPVVVANGGEEVAFEYIPEAGVAIPDPFNPYAEIHTRTLAVMDERPVERVITWLTWDADCNWPLEYAVGQGFCPHRGIRYVAEESAVGEIVIDLSRSDLSADVVSQIQGQMPSHAADATSFPYDGNPATLGAFFGHVAPLNPEEHIGEEMSVEVHFVLFYGEDT